MRVELIAVEGLPEVDVTTDLAAQIVAHAAPLEEGDVVVVAQKVISKAEGEVRNLRLIKPGERAQEIATGMERDPRIVQLVLDESREVIRDGRVLIVESHHGYICANAGIDRSNVSSDGDMVTVLPKDCDASAQQLRMRFGELTGKNIGVIVSDTFGRPFRKGIHNVALGVAGIPAIIDYRGKNDDYGHELHVTMIAVADEIAGAAELVMGKTRRVPAVIVRGLEFESADGEGTGRDLLIPQNEDMFR